MAADIEEVFSALMTAELVPVRRPNGQLYRPRKMVAYQVPDEDDIISAVLVLGTHDIARAQALADQVAARYADSGCIAADPVAGWWRDGFEGGRRCWVKDDRRGRAGVMFREIVERPYFLPHDQCAKCADPQPGTTCQERQCHPGTCQPCASDIGGQDPHPRFGAGEHLTR